MWVQALSLTDYRSYPQVDIEFTPGVSTLAGMNGQGKTNIVEAIAYLATLGSHRVATDAPLVRQGTEHAVIRARVREEERSVSLDLQVNPGGSNKARINRSPATKAADILGIVRSVLFAPEDLSLVRGDPADRRRFLYDMSVQRHPRMLGVKADYDRVLRQRNALLKSAGGRPSASMSQSLEVWDDQLVDLGSDIIRHRSQLIHDLTPHVQAAYESIAQGATVDVRYRPSSPTVNEEHATDALPEAFHHDLCERREDEFRRGITLVGPHRDDVDLVLNGLPMKGYASHGESWSMALSLRLAAAEVLRGDDVDPIIILDDVFAELDTTRRDHLATMIQGVTQVFITAAVLDDVPAELTGTRFTVTKGQVKAT